MELIFRVARDERRLENWRRQILTWPSWWLHQGSGARSRSKFTIKQTLRWTFSFLFFKKISNRVGKKSHQMNSNAVSQNFLKKCCSVKWIFTVSLLLLQLSGLNYTELKVHKIENFFDSDFGICVISLIVMSKY